MTNLKYICSTSSHVSALKKWHFKKQKQGEGQTLTKLMSTLSLFEKNSEAQKYLAEMDKKPCFSSVVLGLGAITWELVRRAESQAPPAPKSASSHPPQRIPRHDQVWDALGYRQHCEEDTASFSLLLYVLPSAFIKFPT